MPDRRPKPEPELDPPDVLPFPAGGRVPDEIQSSQAKDRIADVVKKAAAGGRTTIVSRGYPIAIIGPVEDIPPAARGAAISLPTTEIKSGQTSIKGIIARGDWSLLTIHGAARAAVYRPKALGHTPPSDSRLARFMDLLEETKALERFSESLHREIARALDMLETTDPKRGAAQRAKYERLTKR